MPGPWVPNIDSGIGGRFGLVFSGHGARGRRVDVTYFRGVATELGDYADADPFGDATFSVTFPAISPLDDLASPELAPWLGHGADVDLWWVPARARGTDEYYPNYREVTDPLSGQPTLITPTYTVPDDDGNVVDRRHKLWEGFVASMEFSQDAASAGLTVQCQGALFQVDRYRAKPFYPARPWAYEALIADVFNRGRHPLLRTGGFSVDWPDGWERKYPSYENPTLAQQILTPLGTAGDRWTGYASRETGSWNPALTGFVQDMLQVMITDAKSGVAVGNSWTLAQRRQSPAAHFPRGVPVLRVRDRFRTPDFTVWVGTPGVTVTLSGDGTQASNIIFGDGISLDGTVWHNDAINARGTRTDYLPLAASRDVYPEHQFPQSASVTSSQKLSRFAPMPLEAYVKFGPGFDQTTAISAAKQMLIRDLQPGWTGTITMSTDPAPGLTRWQVHAGMTVALAGFNGTGAHGIHLHIAQVTHSPANGTIELTVDSRYRDLITVEEARARTRDPLTPVKMLQVGKASVIIEDIQAPWSYQNGSGFIPTASKDMVFARPVAEPFPYRQWLREHPPATHMQCYVQCNADAANPTERWSGFGHPTGAEPVLVSAKGAIVRTEFIAVHHDGEIAQVPFHASFYYVNAKPTAMPLDEHGHSAYINNAFEKTDPLTGFHTPATIQGDPSLIVGWGNRAGGVFRRAGFWPGTEVQGAAPSGIFVDDASWNYDMTSYRTYFGGYYDPSKYSVTDTTIYLELYCEAPFPVFFIGRLFRANPGVGG